MKRLKPFSKKTKQELIAELNTEFNGDVAQMADNYGRTVDELLFTIEYDFMGGGKRVGEKMAIPLEYPSQIHTQEIAEKVAKWANGCIVKQEFINPNVEN